MPVTKSLEPIFLETFKNDAPATTVNILFRTKILFRNRCFLFVVSSSVQRREYDNTIGTVDNYKIQITKIAVLHDVALLPRKLPPRTADTPLGDIVITSRVRMLLCLLRYRNIAVSTFPRISLEFPRNRLGLKINLPHHDSSSKRRITISKRKNRTKKCEKCHSNVYRFLPFGISGWVYKARCKDSVRRNAMKYVAFLTLCYMTSISTSIR